MAAVVGNSIMKTMGMGAAKGIALSAANDLGKSAIFNAGMAVAKANPARYQETRNKLTWAWGAFQGFSPIPTMINLIPLKVGIFVAIILIFNYFSVDLRISIPVAYIAQALVTMVAAHWLTDNALKYGFGL